MREIVKVERIVGKAVGGAVFDFFSGAYSQHGLGKHEQARVLFGGGEGLKHLLISRIRKDIVGSHQRYPVLTTDFVYHARELVCRQALANLQEVMDMLRIQGICGQ